MASGSFTRVYYFIDFYYTWISELFITGTRIESFHVRVRSLMHPTTALECANDIPQVKGLKPLYVLSFTTNVPDCLNVVPQISQVKGFRTGCLLSCTANALCYANDLPQVKSSYVCVSMHV